MDMKDNENSKSYGLCPVCNEPNIRKSWCKPCSAIRFQQDFHKWTSGNKFIDEFIQKAQINAKIPSQ